MSLIIEIIYIVAWASYNGFLIKSSIEEWKRKDYWGFGFDISLICLMLFQGFKHSLMR